MKSIREVMEHFYGLAQRSIVPGLRDSQYVYKDIVHVYAPRSSCWLDLGCGHHLFGGWMKKEQDEVIRSAHWLIGMDYEYQSLRHHQGIQDKLAGDVYKLPFETSSLDLVTANMVMEHLQDPAEALLEIRRALKTRGILIFHTPNSLHYQFRIAALLPQFIKNKLVAFLEGRKETDVFPTFYRINRLDTIDALAKQTGFVVRDLQAINSSAESIMLGPLVVLELIVIKLLNLSRFRHLRSNIIATLEKDASVSA